MMQVGMIGVANYGGHRRHLMRQSGLFRIAAVCDRNAEWLANAAREENAQPYTDFAAMLRHPGLEGVFVSTGADSHTALSVAAMQAGLHVFVEKPLCATAAEIDALRAAQQTSGVVVGVGHNDCTHDPYLQQMKSMVEAGELGTPVTFEKTTAHSGGLEIKPGDWRGDPAKNPGGMLFQCGVHAIHDLLYLFGPIATVSCLMRYDAHSTQTADTAHCLLSCVSGVSGTLNAYHVTPYRHTFGIFGTKGALHKRDDFFDEGTTLTFQPRRRNAKEEETPVDIDPSSDDGTGSLRSFYQAVRTGSPCYPSLLDGARAVAVVFAAEEAAEAGHSVDIPPELR